jgi:hypothetical protein
MNDVDKDAFFIEATWKNPAFVCGTAVRLGNIPEKFVRVRWKLMSEGSV